MNKKVYSDTGQLFGEIEEAHVADNKVDGWRIKVVGSAGSILGGARGVIVPHNYIKAIEDVFIINSSAIPTRDDALSGAETGEDI